MADKSATIADFDEFYAAYPKKKGKLAAFRRWAKMTRPNAQPSPPSLAVLLAAIEAQKKSKDWLKENGQFIKHPATWLHDGAWEDEVEEQKQAEHAERIADERVQATQLQLVQRLAAKLSAAAEADKDMEFYESMRLEQRQYWERKVNEGGGITLKGKVVKRLAGAMARKTE